MGFTSMPHGDANVINRAFCWKPNEHAYGVFDAFIDAESGIVNYSFALTRRDLPEGLNAAQVWHTAGRQLVHLMASFPYMRAPASYQLTTTGATRLACVQW